MRLSSELTQIKFMLPSIAFRFVRANPDRTQRIWSLSRFGGASNNFKVGAFTPALYEEAKKNGCSVISMKYEADLRI